MRIQIRTMTSSTRYRLAGWFTLALFVMPCVARAEDHVETKYAGAHARHHHAPRKANPTQDKAIAACVHERTGPTGGIPAKEALKLCTAISRHDAKIAKAKARAAKAIETCRDEILVACEDETERDHDDGECSIETLQAELAECVATEGK